LKRISSLLGLAGALLVSQPAWAQADTASVLITVESKHDGAIPQLAPQDLRVKEAGKDQTVTGLEPMRGTQTQLLLLIDDSASFSLGSQLNTIRQFISSLPANIQIGVGYMHNGMTQFAQQFTGDHAAAAVHVRLAMGAGGADVSPYDSLSDAIKKWTAAPDVQRRVAVLISSGIEALGGGFAPENPYVNKAIRDAQRAGVVVYGIYNPSAGHFGHTLWRITYGQNLLSQIADETGGEAYVNTFGAPVDLSPYFRSLLDALDRQFLMTFSIKPEGKSEFESLSVRVREKDADVAAPTAIYVKK
jgi:VWFA-related protein